MAQLKPARQEGASHIATGGRTGQRGRRMLRQGAPVGDEVREDLADAQGQGKALGDECNVFRGLRRPVVSYELAQPLE